MLSISSKTAPTSAPRRYESPKTRSVRAIVSGGLIMRQAAAEGDALWRFRKRASATVRAKTSPHGGRRLVIGSVRCGLICLLLAMGGRQWARAQGGYSITDLGFIDQWYSETHGLNNGGWAVGEYEPAGALYQHAFLYDGQSVAGLGLSPDHYSIAWGINDSNVIVGEYLPRSPSTFIVEAFQYSNGVVTGLGYLSSSSYSSAHAINSQGQIVGESSTNSTGSVMHAVLWDNGTNLDLGVLGGTYSSANAINHSGLIVGESSVEGSPNVQAFIYTNNMLTLGTLGGDYSSAKGINDAGVVVGESTEVTGGVTNLQAFVYQNGSMASLSAQASAVGADSSGASAINNLGQIVGYVGYGPLNRAFLFDGTNLVHLNQYVTPGSGFANLSSAYAINDKGQIIGSGTLTNGDYHGYLLTPSKPWILLSAPALASGNGFQMTIEGVPGVQFVVQMSTNLFSSNWVSLCTNVLTTNILTGSQTNYTDPEAINSSERYYRALLLQQGW